MRRHRRGVANLLNPVALNENRLIAEHLPSASIEKTSGLNQRKSRSWSLAPRQCADEHRHDCQRFAHQDFLLEFVATATAEQCLNCGLRPWRLRTAPASFAATLHRPRKVQWEHDQ